MVPVPETVQIAADTSVAPSDGLSTQKSVVSMKTRRRRGISSTLLSLSLAGFFSSLISEFLFVPTRSDSTDILGRFYSCCHLQREIRRVNSAPWHDQAQDVPIFTQHESAAIHFVYKM